MKHYAEQLLTKPRARLSFARRRWVPGELAILLAVLAVVGQSVRAAQVWTGPVTTFTLAAGADPTQAANQDRLTPQVWITRGASAGIYNAKTESVFTRFLSPADTEWAYGTLANHATLTYKDWEDWFGGRTGGGPGSTLGRDAVAHLISEDIYVSVIFTSWGGSGGGFSYQRSTPPPANQPPIVAITSPTNGAFFTAPARVIIAATASDTDGSVTNLEFFDSGLSLGRYTSGPYGLLADLAVGTHDLTAAATDNQGATTTSSTVRVTVLSNPPANPAVFTGIVVSNKFPSPPLTVTNVPVITNGLVTFRWQGDAYGKFDLLYAATVGGNAIWNLAQGNIIGSASGSNFLSDPPYLASPAYAPNSDLFYRLSSMPPAAPPLALRLEVVATNLVSPTVVTHAHDGSGRLFVADQVGQIRIVDNTGRLLPTPFLDLSGRLVTLQPNYDERGLLGLAFHPGYPTNGRFFVYYAAPPPSSNYDNMTVLSEFRVSATDTNLADPASERVLLTINEPEFNHEGADVVFGPDGYLYLGPGDGGGAGDQHGTTGNGQSLSVLLGKLLRIDVDSGSPYGIPADNPFVNTPGARPEIYAYGLRNPWRFSFDRGGTHQGFVADVGQNLWEELDLLRKGANYGWRIMEGSHIFDPTVATALGVSIPALDFPIFEYGHGPLGISIIGGFVYRGSAYPELVGKYVFGDFSTGFGSPDGQIYYLVETRPGIWERFSFQLWPDNGRLGRFIKGFGEDEAGELYVLSTTKLGPAGNTGDIRRLVRP
ncbi:MAG: PQQ-dependent sugar dehydrogenase [Verrucomicrobiota bacterium]|jgi:glucose/arabinose dehydrogenase